MNELASVGFILILALVAGHLMKWVRVPEVTGYILCGVAIGPSMLRLVSPGNLTALGIFSDVALGLILFSIGSIFELKRFRNIRSDVLKLVVADAAVVFVLMFIAMRLAGEGWQTASLMATISIETAAASTLMVMREQNAEGTLTDTLTGMIALNNVICLTVFTVIVGIVSYSVFAQSATHAGTVLHESIYRVLWQLLGSAALGYLMGLLLGFFGSRVHEHGELLILLIGSVLMTVGLALVLRLSTLVASLALGAMAANYSDYSRRVFALQSRSDPPFYAIFFVIAGANLHVSLLKTVGIIGLIYFVVRAVAKYIAARTALRFTHLPAIAKEAYPYGVFAHAGLAIGLVLILDRRLPTLAPRVATVVLACVLVYELVGPLTAKIALVRAGESRPEREAVLADGEADALL